MGCSCQPYAGRWEFHTALSRTSPGSVECADARPPLASRSPTWTLTTGLCCFLLVPGGLGGDPILQLPPHHPFLGAEVVQVGSLPGRGLVLGVFLLDVQQEFLWLRRHGWSRSLASNHRCHGPRVRREHWGDGGRGEERGGRAGRQECRAVPVHGGGGQAEQRLLSSQH